MALRIVKKSQRVDCDEIRRICARVREGLELTQAELATRAGASVAMIQRIEQGIQHTFPRELYEALIKLAEEVPSREPPREPPSG